MCLKLQPSNHLNVTSSKTAALKDFKTGNFACEYQMPANPFFEK